jgi:hypothetical protein
MEALDRIGWQGSGVELLRLAHDDKVSSLLVRVATAAASRTPKGFGIAGKLK